MKLNRLLFNNPNYVLEGEIDFSSLPFNDARIKKIGVASIKIKGNNYDELFVMDVQIKVNVIGTCSYTLEDVDIPLSIKDSISFSSEVQDDEDLFYEPNNIFEIDHYILSLIISEVPDRVIKKGANLPSSGSGYRVLSEDEYLKEKETKKDSRWNKLDDIDL